MLASVSPRIAPTSPNLDVSSARCVKRDGRTVPFDIDKVRSAVTKCFKTIGFPESERPAYVEKITRGVIYNVASKDVEVVVDVEDIQRMVIQQLWVEELYEAAEHYQVYREQRRLAREQRPIPAAHAAMVAEDQCHFPTDLQYYQFISKFSRWNDEAQRRETWREACNRVMGWFKEQPKVLLSDGEWQMLDDAMYNLQASPAMRVVQMAGPSLRRCNIGVYNCAYSPILDLFSFSELLYVLMQGTGQGFSVETDYVDDLPKIKKQRKEPIITKHVVGDSTEGWCDALYLGLQKWFAGEDVEFVYDEVRPAGTRLKTKGGRASGPDPLKMLLEFTRALVLNRQGKYLTDLDVHDLCCMIGKIVQVGGVRRASLISLSELGSHEMRHAKDGEWWRTHKHRMMSNNSAVYDGRPSVEQFMDEWLTLIRSRSGERGIFNRQAIVEHLPTRRKKARFGMNPCGEILLRPCGLCNLSIAVARPDDTEETLTQKVIVATYFGTMQATCTEFRYVRPRWKENAEEERLLGVDITGQADCPLLQFGAPGREALLNRLRAVVAKTNAELAERFGINRSAADTCVKPGGDSSVFFDCGSGVSARFAAQQIRWVRESVHSPVARFLISEGVPYATAPEDPTLLVFGFPKQAPANCTLRNDLTALQQLENWLAWKQNWAEHSVSATIYVEDHEWLEVGNWVYTHFDHITGLSFLPKDNGVYSYAPNEELDAETYAKFESSFPALNWAKLARFETDDNTEASSTYACVGGACAL